MGRATPILKRTCNINLVLEEKNPLLTPAAAKSKKKEGPSEVKARPLIQKEEKISVVPEEKEEKAKPFSPARPYNTSSQSKKRFFSRQTFGNIKKVFRRKSI